MTPTSSVSTAVFATPPPVREVTPLLVSQTSSYDDTRVQLASTTTTHQPSDDTTTATASTTGQASVVQTILNLAKTCMGTGCLALPFVCQQGGITVFVLGNFGIAAWNVYAVERLCRCLDYIPRDESSRQARRRRARRLLSSSTQDDETTSFYSDRNEDDNDGGGGGNKSHSEWVLTQKDRNAPPPGTTTLGVVTWFAFGKNGLQALDVMLLILFMGIIISYLVATTSFLGDTPISLGALWDTFVAAMFMCLLSLVPDMGYLSRMSATGLTVLIVSFAVIAIHGSFVHQDREWTDRIGFWPVSAVGLSQWFGVAVFGYGIVPLAYNFRESMAEPQRMVGATTIALTLVALLYIVIGVGLYVLYPDVAGEILHELGGGLVPVLTRLAMVFVVIFTTPLLILPCSELVEGKLHIHPDHDVVSTPLVAVRVGIVAVAGFIAVLLPGFVQVLSFVGCACVGLVGFCLPPILHMRLLQRFRDGALPYRTRQNLLLLDGLMVAWGVFATIVSSAYTFGKLIQ